MSERPPFNATSELPPFDMFAAETALEAIHALNRDEATLEYIDQLVNQAITGYAVRAPIFEPGLTLFRARICERPTHVRELLYPPPHLTPLGRCNHEGLPLLYCAT